MVQRNPRRAMERAYCGTLDPVPSTCCTYPEGNPWGQRSCGRDGRPLRAIVIQESESTGLEDGRRVSWCGLWSLCLAQNAPASLGKCLTTDATAEETDTIVPIDLTHSKIALARARKAQACRIDTEESVQGG